MAHLSPDGERATLALIADLYAQIVDLREALTVEQQRRIEDRAAYEEQLIEQRRSAQTPN